MQRSLRSPMHLSGHARAITIAREVACGVLGCARPSRVVLCLRCRVFDAGGDRRAERLISAGELRRWPAERSRGLIAERGAVTPIGFPINGKMVRGPETL